MPSAEEMWFTTAQDQRTEEQKRQEEDLRERAQELYERVREAEAAALRREAEGEQGDQRPQDEAASQSQ